MRRTRQIWVEMVSLHNPYGKDDSSKRKKKDPREKNDKAVIHRKKYQPFSHESSNRCSQSKSLTLVGTRSWAKSQEDYSRLKLSGFPDLLSRSSWLEHIKLLLEQSKEIFPIRSLVQIPLVCQLWHHKQRQKRSLWLCLFVWNCIYFICFLSFSHVTSGLKSQVTGKSMEKWECSSPLQSNLCNTAALVVFPLNPGGSDSPRYLSTNVTFSSLKLENPLDLSSSQTLWIAKYFQVEILPACQLGGPKSWGCFGPSESLPLGGSD